MIEIRDLSFSYSREKLFSQLNLSLHPGNICGLLGKNGAGKTTLLKLLAGLRFPQNGETRIMGLRPDDRSPGFLQELSFLPEEFSLPSVSPRKYERLYAPFYPRFKSELFSQYLAEFELNPNQNLDRCSFGAIHRRARHSLWGRSSGNRLPDHARQQGPLFTSFSYAHF